MAVVDTGSTGDVTVATAYGIAKISGFNYSKNQLLPRLHQPRVVQEPWSLLMEPISIIPLRLVLEIYLQPASQ